MALFLLAALFSFQAPSPLLDYQAMEELKQKLARQVVEVEVTLKPAEGADPTLVPVLNGQAACFRDHRGRLLMVTSEFLVENAASIRLRSQAQEEWVEARVASRDPKLGLVFLVARGGKPFPCVESKLAPPALAAPEVYAFTVDNPVGGMTNIFFGVIGAVADAPLDDFLVTTVGLPLGMPLFSAEGDLLALNVRRYAPTYDKSYLAVSCRQLFRTFADPHAAPRPERRHPRRTLETK